MRLRRDNRQWRQPARKMRAGKEDALHRAPFARGNPSTERARDTRPGAGFARAE
jgi:hypothetical protein